MTNKLAISILRNIYSRIYCINKFIKYKEKKKKLNFAKKSIIIVSIFLLLTMVTPTVLLSKANAAPSGTNIPTVAFLSVNPNPIGVGQSAGVVMWLDKANPLAQGVWGMRFSGYTVNVTAPDGTSTLLGPFNANAISEASTSFTPNEAGNYTLVFTFPAQVIVNTNPPPTWQAYNHPDQIGDTYLESISNTVILVATSTLTPTYSYPPLPTGYWQVPVNSLNPNWALIDGDWLGGVATVAVPGTVSVSGTGGLATNVNPDSAGPPTAHILWTQPFGLGGIAGENEEASSYLSTGSSSIGYNASPLIVDGIVFLQTRDSLGRNWGWSAVNLYNGQTLYSINGTTVPYPSYATVQTFDDESVHGSWAYLWSITGTAPTAVMSALDPYNGQVVFQINNAANTGTEVIDPVTGAILYYNIVTLGTTANPVLYLQCWNTTAVCSPLSATGDPTRPYSYTGVYNGATGFSENVSIPNVAGSILAVVAGQYIVGGTTGDNNASGPVIPGNIWEISIAPDNFGTEILNYTFTPPPFLMDPTQYYYYGAYDTVNQVTGAVVGTTALPAEAMVGPWVYPTYNVFVYWQGATRQFWGFNLATGKMIWGPTPSQDVWMLYGMQPTVDNGMLLTSLFNQQSPGGQITAYNITTGAVIWTYLNNQSYLLPGYEKLSYSNPPEAISVISGDGQIYTVSEEHSPSMPLRPDATITDLNETTGTMIWQLPFYMRTQLALSVGYIIGGNMYDNKFYCIGKGHSATTVTAPDAVQPFGSEVLLQGTVTDQSPGALGTPAIADADQEAWMEYLYMQQPMPFNVTGVPVSLDAYDPNGNLVHIGTATSDGSGHFSYIFTPQVPANTLLLLRLQVQIPMAVQLPKPPSW